MCTENGWNGTSQREALKWRSGYLWMQCLSNFLHSTAQPWVRIRYSEQGPSYSSPYQAFLMTLSGSASLQMKAVITASRPGEIALFKPVKMTHRAARPQRGEAGHLSRLDIDSSLSVVFPWTVDVHWPLPVSQVGVSAQPLCLPVCLCLQPAINWLGPGLDIWPMSFSSSQPCGHEDFFFTPLDLAFTGFYTQCVPFWCP